MGSKLRDIAGDLEDDSALENNISIMAVRLRLEPAIEEAEAELDRLREEVDHEKSVLAMAVARLGGKVEGQQTHRGNFLQRIDELRVIESERSRLRRALEALLHPSEAVFDPSKEYTRAQRIAKEALTHEP